MNETKKMKFPVAAIFTALLALGLIENLRSLLLRAGMLDQMIGYRMVVEFGSTLCANEMDFCRVRWQCRLYYPSLHL